MLFKYKVMILVMKRLLKMGKLKDFAILSKETSNDTLTYNASTGEVLSPTDEALLMATKKYVLRLLRPHDFVLINGIYEAKRDGLIKILSSLPISYEWRLTKTDVRDTYSKIEGTLTVNVGDLIRSSSGLGICELSELRGNGGLHFCTARAETRALKRAIEVLFGSVINYFVLNYLEVKVA